MSQSFTRKVITANALIEGDVVYLTEDDRWCRALTEAEIIEDEAHAQIRLLDASARSDEVVGVYLADVIVEGGNLRAGHFREAFRATGPSNYFHGKQEQHEFSAKIHG